MNIPSPPIPTPTDALISNLPTGALPSIPSAQKIPEMSSFNFGNSKYNLLKRCNVDKNVKEIGDKIVAKIKEKYIENTEDNVGNVKAQLKKDVLSIYYADSGDKSVRDNILNTICKYWYNALKIRNETIITELKEYLKHQNMGTPAEKEQEGGFGLGDIKTPDLTKDITSDLTNFLPNSIIPPNTLNDNKTENPNSEETKGQEGTQGTQGTTSQDNKDNSTEKLQSLIDYKVKLVADEYFGKDISLSKSASLSTVYNLHTSMVEHLLCSYATIPRNQLMDELRIIIAGPEIIPNYTSDTEPPKSIYQLFTENIDKLSSANYINKSESIIRKQKQEGGEGENCIDKFYPTAYNLSSITNHVDKHVEISIKDKINALGKDSSIIKDGFQDVFLMANCDSLDINNKTSQPILLEYMNTEYHKILDALCENISSHSATKILQSYILRNFDDFTKYLETIFGKDKTSLETYVWGFSSSNMTNDNNILPDPPKVVLKKLQSENADCCGERKGEQNLDSAGVSEYLKMKNANQKEGHFYTPAIIHPLFVIIKKDILECKQNVDFLAKLFAIYSSKCRKFMQQIRLQFEDDNIYDFIERYVLTRHPYTLNIVSECIKHVADIKITLSSSRNVDKTQLVGYLSHYCAYLMHLVSENEKQINTYFTTYIRDGIASSPLSSKLMDIQTNIIDKIPPQEQNAYENALQNVFAANMPNV